MKKAYNKQEALGAYAPKKPKQLFDLAASLTTGLRPVKSTPYMAHELKNPRVMILVTSPQAMKAVLVAGSDLSVLKSCIDAANSEGLGLFNVKQGPTTGLELPEPKPSAPSALRRQHLAPRFDGPH